MITLTVKGKNAKQGQPKEWEASSRMSFQTLYDRATIKILKHFLQKSDTGDAFQHPRKIPSEIELYDIL